MSHVRSLSQQLEAAAAAQPMPGGLHQVHEVVVGAVAPLPNDNNVSMLLGASSAVSNFAGGGQEDRRVSARDTHHH